VNDQATIQTECLSADTMRSYWQGLTADHEVETIEQHLQNCPQCMALFKRFENSNEQVDILRDLFAADIKRVMPRPILSGLPHENEGLRATRNNSPWGGDEESDCHPWQSWLPPTKQIGPYRVVRTIGHGGMGAVVLAEHVRLRRQFAMKLLYVPRSFSRAQSRFKREAEAIGRLHHPSIVTASDAGQEGSLHYLVMEYVDGFDLSKLSRLVEDFSVCDVSEIGRQIALALAYAHEQGLVHRDIKPSNIMLDADGRIKLLDFGLVQLDRWNDELSELTSVGQFLGTLDYMAPEQAERSGQVDHRADLYGLGATMFRLLCGRAPLATTPHLSPLEKLRLLAHHAPPSLRTMRNDAPEELVQIVDRLLATDPNNRPLNAESVAEHLTRLAEGSNLRRLIELGRASQSVTESSDEANHDIEKANAVVPDATPATQQQTISTRPPNRWRRYGGLVALGLLPIAFVAGILLQIPVEEGMLLIESELPEGEIKIVRSKDGHEQRLKVDVGPQVTKLLAGKYSLELNSPSDSISIENDTFVVSKGETVVAKVRLKRNETQEVVVDAEPPPAIPTPAASAIEARFQGKNLTEWLEIYERQKNGRLPEETARAMVVLLGHSAEQSLFEHVFEKLLSSRHKVLKEWGDPRIPDVLFDRFEKMNDADKRAFLQQTVRARILSGQHLSKIMNWIDDQHAANTKDAGDWFESLSEITPGMRVRGGGNVSPYTKPGSDYIFLNDFPLYFDWLTELEKTTPQLLRRYDCYYLEATLWWRLGTDRTGEVNNLSSIHNYLVLAAERVFNSANANREQRIIATRILIDNQNTLSRETTKERLFKEYRYLIGDIPYFYMQRFHWGNHREGWDPMESANYARSRYICNVNWTVTPGSILLQASPDDLLLEFYPDLIELGLALRESSEAGLKWFESRSPSNPLAGINQTWGIGSTVVLESVTSYPPDKQDDVKQMLTQTQALMLQLRLFEILVNSKNADQKTIVRDFKRYLESLEEWRDLLRKANKEKDGVIANSDLQDRPEAIELLNSKGFTIPLDQPINLPSYLETKYRDQ
jgi:serine/threonine protein kinase